MNSAGTIGPQAGIMLRCGIAFVLVKAVGWIFLRISQHQPIACDFGQHRGCGNGSTTRITSYDKALCNCRWQGGYPIDEQHVWDTVQLLYSTQHSCFGSPQDVVLINLRV